MTEEVMMIPRQEFERLQDFYKGKITQSALLNKAGRLAAEKHMILKNPKIPDATAVRLIKPLAREQGRLTKRIRTGSVPTAGVGVPDEDEAMVEAPLEALLKQIIKGQSIKKEPVTPLRIKKEPATPGPSGIKKTPSTSKPPIPPKPASLQKSTSEKKSGGFKKAVLSGAAKGFLKSIGVDPKYIDEDEEEEETPKARPKGKQPKKTKQTEAEKLSQGWEGWDEPLRRKLSYGKGKKP